MADYCLSEKEEAEMPGCEEGRLAASQPSCCWDCSPQFHRALLPVATPIAEVMSAVTVEQQVLIPSPFAHAS